LSRAVDTVNADFATCTYNESTIVPGIPRVVEVLVRVEEAGEYMGEIQLYTRYTLPNSCISPEQVSPPLPPVV
jgi:hypothetical protein